MSVVDISRVERLCESWEMQARELRKDAGDPGTYGHISYREHYVKLAEQLEAVVTLVEGLSRPTKPATEEQGS